MKRWSTNRGGWSRVPRQRLEVRQVGSTTLVYLKALSVREPLTVPCCGRRVKIMDVGYQWLSICRKGARHIVTAHCNDVGEPVHLYIDVIASWHVGEDGFPCFGDLYLDVIALPDGQVEIIDGDELEAALKARVISRAQYEEAWREVKKGCRRPRGRLIRADGGRPALSEPVRKLSGSQRPKGASTRGRRTFGLVATHAFC